MNEKAKLTSEETKPVEGIISAGELARREELRDLCDDGVVAHEFSESGADWRRYLRERLEPEAVAGGGYGYADGAGAVGKTFGWDATL